ncbi:hypothetical protein ES705_31750 [subsurface metagenome]
MVVAVILAAGRTVSDSQKSIKTLSLNVSSITGEKSSWKGRPMC